MKRTALIVMSGTALALAACGSNNHANNVTTDESNLAVDNGMMGNTAMGNAADMNAAAPAASPLTAQAFANAAAASDNFEIQSSKMAETQASSAAVKTFAGKMISAHTASTAKLKGITSGMSPAITPDDTLNPDQQAAIDSLKGQKGAAFDSAYAAAQVDGHQKTLDALRAYAASGDNDKLKGFATDMIPTVTAHLNMAKGLK